MNNVLYATGNDVKFRQANDVCKSFNLTLVQDKLDVPEIQGEDSEIITRDKAEKAYAMFKKPVVISDDSWSIPGLNGFPGAYMKSVNEWFTVDDWLNLTRTLTDKRVVLRQIVIYQDADGQKLFSCDIEGVLLSEPRGKSIYPHSYIVSFDGGKTSNAEHHERNTSSVSHLPNVWHDFAEWYSKTHAK